MVGQNIIIFVYRLTENNHRTILNKFEYADLHKIIIIIIVRKVIIYNLCVYLVCWSEPPKQGERGCGSVDVNDTPAGDNSTFPPDK